MRFTIQQTGCGSERVGILMGFMKSPNAVIETPTSALLTQSASVVHLTAEVLSKVFTNPKLLWVPLSKTIHLETGAKAQGEGIANFAGVPNHITCATLHNVGEFTPSGHFELHQVPVWTKHGKKMISGDRYMDLMEIFKPDIILAIADGRTPLDEGNKRITKSVERTCKLLDVCVQRHKTSSQLQDSSLIGVIVGASVEKKLDECIQHILSHKQSLSGVALQGITDGSEESFAVPLEKLEAVFKKVSDILPKDLLRIIEGCWNPPVILTAIQYGWDVFDGSYPLKLTNKGQALALNFELSRNSDELCILDLNNSQYKDDFHPILENCECLACKKHTRAYIHHLLNTREMLSSVLISIAQAILICTQCTLLTNKRGSGKIEVGLSARLRKYLHLTEDRSQMTFPGDIDHYLKHNLHHFDQMFHHARLHIASNTFGDFKHHVIKQYDQYKSQTIKEDNSDSDSNKQLKKIRVSDDTIST